MRLLFNLLLTIWSCLAIQPLQAPMHIGVDERPFWIERISRSIERIEGGNKVGTLPWRLHNPGGLIWARQINARRDKTGYAAFNRREDGQQAVRNIVSHRFEWGRPLNYIIKPWGSKENRKVYVEAVRLETGWRGE